MAFSAALADRIRTLLAGQRGVSEQKMFGGIGFLRNGNMCVGVRGDSLLVRYDPEDAQEVLAAPHVTEFAMSGRPMKGWAVVGPPSIDSDAQLAVWVKRASAYVETLPAK